MSISAALIVKDEEMHEDFNMSPDPTGPVTLTSEDAVELEDAIAEHLYRHPDHRLTEAWLMLKGAMLKTHRAEVESRSPQPPKP
jgi:hypothetical protein